MGLRAVSVLHAVLYLRGWKGRIFDIALGALAVLGQAPFHIWPATIFALCVLKLRLDFARFPSAQTASGPNGPYVQSIQTRRRGFYIAGRFGFGYFLFGLFWIGSAFIARGPAFIPLMPPMILGLALLLALFWAISGRLYVGLTVSKPVSIAAFTALFTLAELARGHILSGLPWNLTGYIFPAGGAFSQIAAFTGIYGLTCLTFLISAGFSTVLSVPSKQAWSHKALWAWPFLSLLILASLFGFGHMRLSNAEIDYVEDVTLRIAQVPFDQADQLDPRKSVEIVNQFIDVSLAPGLETVTHIVWPEGAVTGLVLENQSLMSVFGQALAERTSPAPVWLLQTLRHEQKPQSRGVPVDAYYNADAYYNSAAAVVFDRTGTASLAGINDKSKLVPFGEFIPGGLWVRRLGFKTLSTALASLTPAKTKLHSDFPGLPRVSPQICYEIIFPGLTPRHDPDPALWILNQSNDAWYGRSTGPHQHFNQARYRALEEGMPIIRAASNGISGVVDPYGRVLERAGMQEKVALDVSLPKSIPQKGEIRPITFYLLLINLLISIVCVIIENGYSKNIRDKNQFSK